MILTDIEVKMRFTVFENLGNLKTFIQEITSPNRQCEPCWINNSCLCQSRFLILFESCSDSCGILEEFKARREFLSRKVIDIIENIQPLESKKYGEIGWISLQTNSRECNAIKILNSRR
ncbi:uncharacterized protein LOC113232863 [Hyposmocoma kahamanoa]|uniref:uncharacterized protein LOC113232863 n=1 Tax=Hyposmocoma kahamanoa TaxID=1477025 RepID=UPI000E6D5E54|nr:uncharacterized protein LOC113232863 [Hyposmocoma kahamanoa]